MAQNLKHVDHVLWVCRAENQERYVEQLAELTEAEFRGPLERDDLGVRIYISLSSGLEVVSPLKINTGHSQLLEDHLAIRGEGLFGVVFGVSDIDKARDRAISLGYEVSPLIENSGDEEHAKETDVMKEVLVGDFMNSVFLFGEIRYAKGILQTSGD